ncbi:MAG: hypothetical protein HQM04_09095 [Magnetococcales bacterium]|nr:hypothetical protein [Magnetococcales bacterium]MBF0115187.1 hypothetical protein [Magnetococcales bacterium]
MNNKFPETCLLDTNVPKTANLAINPNDIPDELVDCVQMCVKAVEHVIRTKGLVLDDGDEIFDEYRKNISMSGQPGVGDKFMKWVHDNRWNLPESNRVEITKQTGINGYSQFPNHVGLRNFDRSDRKFVAVANAHPNKPPILEATDSKWWGWKDALLEVGITVQFMCPDYIEPIFRDKTKT